MKKGLDSKKYFDTDEFIKGAPVLPRTPHWVTLTIFFCNFLSFSWQASLASSGFFCCVFLKCWQATSSADAPGQITFVESEKIHLNWPRTKRKFALNADRPLLWKIQSHFWVSNLEHNSTVQLSSSTIVRKSLKKSEKDDPFLYNYQ